MSFSLKSLCSNVLPAGTYKVVVEDIKLKVVEGVTTSDIQVNYRVTEGSQKGKGIIDTIYESAFSFRLSPFAQAAGLDMNRQFTKKEEVLDYIIKSAKGAVLMVEVIIKNYNGNDYNNIKSFAALPGSSTTTDEVLKELNLEEIKGEKPHLDDLPFNTEDTKEPDIEPTIDVEKLF